MSFLDRIWLNTFLNLHQNQDYLGEKHLRVKIDLNNEI